MVPNVPMRNIHTIRLNNARELASQFDTKAQFAEKLGKEPTQVSRFMGKNPTKKIGDLIAEQIESAFGKPKGWLDIDHRSIAEPLGLNNESWAFVEFKKYTHKKVPLINWVQAGCWAVMDDDFETDNYYPCPENHSEHTFALTVVGESMSPEFTPGEIIFVDPEVEARSGSYVVVRQNGNSEATFKQLMFDENKKYLKALNPNWPNPIIEMLSDAVICGVVIGSYKKRNH
jgi:SOS-response transcriptional repressor LexA